MMEHLLYLCPNYSEPLWAEASTTLTTTIAHHTQEYTARIDLTPKEIIYKKPHPAILLTISDKHVRNTILIFIQEVKWDIIFRRMQLKEPNRQEVPKIRLQAHLLSVIRKLISLLEYQGIVHNKLPLTFLRSMQEMLTLKHPIIPPDTSSLVNTPPLGHTSPTETHNTHSLTMSLSLIFWAK
jgi:hypothetical protein